MEYRDFYTQHQIDELKATLTNLIASASDAINANAHKDFIEQANQGLMAGMNITIDEINNIQLEHFIATITVDSFMDNKNLDLLADLFFHLGKAFAGLHEKESAKRIFHRSLMIYKYLLKAEVDFPYERHLRIKELNEILLQ